MKKVLILTLLVIFSFCGVASARAKYDKYNHIIYDNTIRGEKRAVQAKQFQGAAAAKINYDENNSLKDNYKYNTSNSIQNNLKNNYYNKN